VCELIYTTGLNDLKNFDINDKERFGRLIVVKEDEMQEDGKKSWKR